MARQAMPELYKCAIAVRRGGGKSKSDRKKWGCAGIRALCRENG